MEIYYFDWCQSGVVKKGDKWETGADLEGGASACAPSIFCRDKAPDFVWVPQAKRMHQIVGIDFENCNFSSLLRGHIPRRHLLSPQVPKFCKPLMWAPPLLKNPGSAPERGSVWFRFWIMVGDKVIMIHGKLKLSCCWMLSWSWVLMHLAVNRGCK